MPAAAFATHPAVHTNYQQWNSNIYWWAGSATKFRQKREDSFHIQGRPGKPGGPACVRVAVAQKLNLQQWQKRGEDTDSIVVDPGFANPRYPADDYTLTRSLARRRFCSV